jgi:6,7-dimethyl-8-ribityllumazine synthase
VAEYRGRLRAIGRVAVLVSRYNEVVTAKLLEGALACCRDAGISEADVDVIWLAGAFELGAAAATAAETGRYSAIVALGAVIRGETAHFEFVAGEATRGLGAVACRTGLPIGFGLLTTEDLPQAMARAGGAAGNKGYEATEAALTAADVLAQVRSGRA